jgi:hypothetical protein
LDQEKCVFPTPGRKKKFSLPGTSRGIFFFTCALTTVFLYLRPHKNVFFTCALTKYFPRHLRPHKKK